MEMEFVEAGSLFEFANHGKDMDTQDLDMNEFLQFKLSEEKFFTRDRTLKLLSLYKTYRKKLGTHEVKTMKRLWEVIATDLSNFFKITIPAAKCENRFKVLERSYKKVRDNNNQTGRGRKNFEYEQEMDDIFEKKRNVNPVTLLSSSTYVAPTDAQCTQEPEGLSTDREGEDNTHTIIILDEQCNNENTSAVHNKAVSTNRTKRKKKSSEYHKRNDILLGIKNDLKEYYKEKNKREEEKLEIQRKKLCEKVKRTALLEQYIEVTKQKQ